MMYLMTNLRDQKVQIGEGWCLTKVSQFQFDLLDSRGLIDDGIAHLLNGLADLLAQREGLSSLERDVFEKLLHQFAFASARYAFYAHLLEEQGPERIGKNLWMRFANKLDWPSVTDVVTHMPAAMLEELIQEIWELFWNEKDAYLGNAVRREFIQALGRRTDIYGSESMPPELAFGLLIQEDQFGIKF